MLKKYYLLMNLLNEPYSKVTIELKDNFEANDIRNILSTKGNTADKFNHK